MNYEIFSAKLKELELRREEFAKIVGMNYNSVANWKSKGIPSWVAPFLHYYEKGKDLDKILSLVKKHT